MSAGATSRYKNGAALQEEYKRKGIDLTPEVYLVKLMIGACDRSYDEGDECKLPLLECHSKGLGPWRHSIDMEV